MAPTNKVTNLKVVKNKNKAPTIGNNIKDERIGKFIT